MTPLSMSWTDQILFSRVWLRGMLTILVEVKSATATGFRFILEEQVIAQAQATGGTYRCCKWR